jgi:hypothetical protein
MRKTLERSGIKLPDSAKDWIKTQTDEQIDMLLLRANEALEEIQRRIKRRRQDHTVMGFMRRNPGWLAVVAAGLAVTIVAVTRSRQLYGEGPNLNTM